jgi:hypothetical protein
MILVFGVIGGVEVPQVRVGRMQRNVEGDAVPE